MPDKNYTMLYRKYRPRTFDELVGQEHAVRILTNQVMGGAVGHAYLFTGSRGVGKTSAAKIFAKAINCEHPANGSPCYKCAACKALDDPANVDVSEIDAASNNGVDEIRDLREKVQYPPVTVKRKVYIIDEVHMLTGAAFNAMLKTLEEPPAHAVFILATTEVHKLPATILSRCMRFDFRLVSIGELTGILRKIFADIKKEYEEEALYALAAAAEGSVRDMLSIADMCVAYSGGKLKAADVAEILGAADFKNVLSLAEAVLTGNGGRVLEIIDRLVSAGKSPVVLAKDLGTAFRNLLVFKTCGDAKEILHLTADIAKEYAHLAVGADYSLLFKSADSFARLDSELRYGSNPRVFVEIACLELCSMHNAQCTMHNEGQIRGARQQIAAPSVIARNEAIQNDEAIQKNSVSLRAEQSEAPQGRGAVEDGGVVKPKKKPAKKEPAETKEVPIIEEAPTKEKPVEAAEARKATAEVTEPAAKEAPIVPIEPAAKEQLAETTEPAAQTENEKDNTSQFSILNSQSPAEPMSPRKLWGKVVRELRLKNDPLYPVASDMSAVVLRGDKLVLKISDALAFESLSRPANVAVIDKILVGAGFTFLPEKSSAPDGGAGTRQDLENDVKRILEMGGDAVKISRGGK